MNYCSYILHPKYFCFCSLPCLCQAVCLQQAECKRVEEVEDNCQVAESIVTEPNKIYTDTHVVDINAIK